MAVDIEQAKNIVLNYKVSNVLSSLTYEENTLITH